MANKSCKIIMIEDSEDDIRLFRNMLGDKDNLEFNLSFQFAHTIQDGLDRCSDEHFDAAIVDLNLPDSIGLSSLEKFKAAYPALPVVILTGQNDEEILNEAYEKGANAYIIKDSMNIHILNIAIRNALSDTGFQT